MAISYPPARPFRADHVGSLLRPEALLQARRRAGAGEIDEAGLREFEDAHIESVIRFQEDIGLQSITDGEFRRESWRLGFVHKVEGFRLTDAVGAVDLQQDDAGERRAIGAVSAPMIKVR
jgi:methionine synthase II (cobalamin-independent)